MTFIFAIMIFYALSAIISAGWLYKESQKQFKDGLFCALIEKLLR